MEDILLNEKTKNPIIDEITLMMQFKAIAQDQHDFRLFKVTYNDNDSFYFIKTPALPFSVIISSDLAEQIMYNPTIGSTLSFD